MGAVQDGRHHVLTEGLVSAPKRGQAWPRYSMTLSGCTGLAWARGTLWQAQAGAGAAETVDHLPFER